MSGLAGVFRRDGGPAPPEKVVRGMLARQVHGAPDGTDVVRLGPVVLGHQHFWVTPEERGERQPLVGPGGRLALAFDGRLDNRDELLAELDDVGRTASDAEIVLAWRERRGEAFLGRLLGPFALLLWDPWKRTLLCARDPLGQRTLCYAVDDERLVVASEEVGVLGAPGLDDALDEESIARYFALAEPAPGRTLFRRVREIPPGHALEVGPERHTLRSFWSPPEAPREPAPARPDAEWGEEFLELLERSVRCRLRGVDDPAVLLSGGLDSSSVAAVAARVREAQGEAPPRAVSWCFSAPELSACDETRWSGAVVEHWGLPWTRVPVDDAWPASSRRGWPADPSRAYDDPYGWAVDRAYDAAREAGGRVVLTGYWGDQLYPGGAGWWRELLARGRWSLLAAALPATLGRTWRRRRRWPASLAARLRRLGSGDPAPLHADGLPLASLLSAEGLRLAGSREPAGPGERLVQPFHTWMGTSRVRRAAGRGVDLREPLRDRRLVEWVHRAPPPEMLRRGRWDRYLCRCAMAGQLPDPVRWRQAKTSLAPFLELGLGRELPWIRGLLDAPDASWDRYLERSALDARGAGPVRSDAACWTGFWLAISYQRWALARASSRSLILDDFGGQAVDVRDERSPHPTPRRLTAESGPPAEPRKPYVPPRLELAGEVAAMTLGSAGFNAESGGTFFEL